MTIHNLDDKTELIFIITSDLRYRHESIFYLESDEPIVIRGCQFEPNGKGLIVK